MQTLPYFINTSSNSLKNRWNTQFGI